MDFTVKSVNSLEKEFNLTIRQVLKDAKVKNVDELNHTVLMKLNKDPLANFVDTLAKMINRSIELCKSAAGTIDELKTEQLENQQKLITLQKEQMDSVRDTVKTEMKSWSDIVKQNSTTTATSVKNVKKVVKSVVDENERTKNFIVYGAEDIEGDSENNEMLCDIVSEVFGVLNEFPKPQVLSVSRLGTFKPDSATATRPIKVTLASSEEVKRVLSIARKLKKSTEYKDLYLAPDRTAEERLAHRKLVADMKKLIASEPSKYHYIRDNKVISVDKT